MAPDIQPHALEKAALAEAIHRWLYEYHQAGVTNQLKEEVAQLQQLLRVLHADIPLARADRDVLLMVMARRIHKLQNYVHNPSSYFGPPILARPSGLLGWLKARRAARSDALAREEVLRNFRRNWDGFSFLKRNSSPPEPWRMPRALSEAHFQTP